MRNRTTALLKRDSGLGAPKAARIASPASAWSRSCATSLSDPIALFDRTANGQRTFKLREIHAMPAAMRRCISSIKVRTENLTAGDDGQDRTVEVKLWDKVRALSGC
jgi:hypothetical protein